MAIVVLALALAAYFLWFNKQEKVDYITETVSRGDLAVTVNATGTVGAAQKVTVGAQLRAKSKSFTSKWGMK